MADTVKLPAIGQVKKNYVYAGLAAVGGIVIYAYWKSRSQAVAPSEGDLVPSGSSDVRTPPSTVDVGTGATIDETQGAPTDFASWAQRAVQLMTEQGYDPAAVSAALGKLYARLPLNADEARLARTAKGLLGEPPGGSWPITEAIVPTPSPTTPKRPGAPTGLRVIWQANHKQYVLSWNPVGGATGYGVYRNGQKFAFVNDTNKAIGNQTAAWTVQAHNAQNLYGPPSFPIATRKR